MHNHQWLKTDIPRFGYTSNTFYLPPPLGIMVRKTNDVPLLSDLCEANYSLTMSLSQTPSSEYVHTRRQTKPI